MNRVAIVVPPCCFKPSGSRILCPATEKRLTLAQKLFEGLTTRNDYEVQCVLLGGGVPQGLYSLGQLMLARIQKASPQVIIQTLLETSGVGTVSDAESVARWAGSNGLNELVVVSHAWWHLSAEPVWRHLAQEGNIKYVKISTGWGEAGVKTLLRYAVYGIATRLCFSRQGQRLHCHEWLSRKLYEFQKPRRQKFSFDGCG